MNVSTRSPTAERPRPWLAALLSFFAPGVGHYYLGVPAAAVAIFAGVWVLGFAAFWVAAHAPGRGVVLLLPFYSLLALIGVPAHAWFAARRRADAGRWYRRPTAVAVAVILLAAMVSGALLKAKLRARLVETLRAPSGAMAPTMVVGDWVLVVPERTTSLAEGEVVAFVRDGDPLVKRIVALPGDTIESRRGQLLRNGSAVAEPYLSATRNVEDSDSSFAWQGGYLADPRARGAYHPTADSWGPLVVPPHEVFLLGDNRHFSLDSRYFGFVDEASIFARPTKIYFSWSADSSAVRWDRIGREIR